MAENTGTGTATKQTPNPEPKSTQGQPAAAPAAQPAQDEPKPTTKTEEKQTVKTDSDRTKSQFDKLLDSNKRLYDANELLRQQLTQRALSNEQFAPIQQPPIQAQQKVNVADFVEIDPTTGERFIDDKKLQLKIEDLNTKASNAESAVQRYIQTSEQREIDRQNEEAFKAYPELNPSNVETHDVRFHNQTRALIYDSLINPQDYGGKPLSFKKAADFVKGGDTVTDSEKNQQASASKDKPEGQTVAADDPSGEDAKQQAAASVAGEQPITRDAVAGSEELTKLQQATRFGDTEALARRIANSDHIKVEEGEKAS